MTSVLFFPLLLLQIELTLLPRFALPSFWVIRGLFRLGCNRRADLKMCYGQRMDNPEGQVTYLISLDKTAGLPTGSGTPCRCTLRFYLC